MLKQKDDEVEGIDKVAKRLQEERGKVADIIRQEFADRYVFSPYVINIFSSRKVMRIKKMINEGILS